MNSSAICATEDVALCSPVRSRGRGFVLQQPPKVDIERSAQNWIDLGNILATLPVRFHSMYCARATGEHHYFTVPLADVANITNLVYRSLSSLNRPSRYITMTTSAGKLSILGEATSEGAGRFALKFNESRNMAWMDEVFLAEYDGDDNRVDRLKPFDTEEFFFEDELRGHRGDARRVAQARGRERRHERLQARRDRDRDRRPRGRRSGGSRHMIDKRCDSAAGRWPASPTARPS